MYVFGMHATYPVLNAQCNNSVFVACLPREILLVHSNKYCFDGVSNRIQQGLNGTTHQSLNRLQKTQKRMNLTTRERIIDIKRVKGFFF